MGTRTKADPRAKASAAGYRKAKKLAEREHRVRKSNEARVRKAQERLEAKALERQAKIDEAAEGYVDLPALVTRDGTVKPLSMEQAIAVVELYFDALGVDVEHSGYDVGDSRYELRTIQLGGEEMTVVFDAADPMQAEIVKWALGAAEKLHAFAAIADIIPLVLAGFIDWDSAWDKMHDGVIYVKLTDPRLAGSEANGLKDLSRDLLREYAVSPAAEKAKNALFKAIGCNINTDSSTPPEKNGWNMVDKRAVAMIRYAGCDVLDLAAVLRFLPPLPVSQEVLDREREVQARCARVALDGFALDFPHIKQKILEHETSKAEHRSNTELLTSGKVINPSAPGVGAALIELWPALSTVLDRSEDTGEPSAAKKSLAKIGQPVLLPASPTQHEINTHVQPVIDPAAYYAAQEILAYRHDVTTLSLLLRPLETLCVRGDSRMRPTVYTISADTGRMSCVRPNGQQFSRRGGIRACVNADEGMLGISADFSGCEIIVAAGLSGDRGLYEAEISPFCHRCQVNDLPGSPCSCPDKADGERGSHTGLHWLAAHLTFGEDAGKEHRYQAKAVIFKKLFGGAPDSAVAEKIANVFDYKIAPVYKAWDDWLRQCYDSGSLVYRDYSGAGENYAVDLAGRRRYAIYRTYSKRQIYAGKGAHAVGNYAIQGTARELLVDGILLWGRSKWGHLPILPVHDQVICFVPREEASEATRELVRCMRTTKLSTQDWEVVIDADADEPFDAWPDSS
jgi:hypothetical protein